MRWIAFYSIVMKLSWNCSFFFLGHYSNSYSCIPKNANLFRNGSHWIVTKIDSQQYYSVVWMSLYMQVKSWPNTLHFFSFEFAFFSLSLSIYKSSLITSFLCHFRKKKSIEKKRLVEIFICSFCSGFGVDSEKPKGIFVEKKSMRRILCELNHFWAAINFKWR